MNANSLVERLTGMALALPTGKSGTTTTAQKTGSTAEAPYARELRKSLEKSDKANAATPTEAREKPKASTKPAPAEAQPTTRRDQAAARTESTPQKTVTPTAKATTTQTASSPITSQVAEPAIDVIDEAAISASLADAADDCATQTTPVTNSLAASEQTPAEPMSEEDLQAMIESILAQLQQIANAQAQSPEAQASTNAIDTKTSAIPAGLQQAIEQVMQQASQETEVEDPAAQTKQAIDLIEELISRFGKDVEEDEDEDDDKSDVEDNLSKIQALLEQITGQEQVAETPVVVQVTANVWGDVGVTGQVEAAKPTTEQAVKTPEAELPEVAVEAAPEQGSPSEVLNLEAAEFADVAAETTKTDATNVDPIAEVPQPEPDASALRVDTVQPTTRTVTGTGSQTVVQDVEGTRQAAAIQLINRVSHSISTGATQGEQSFKMQVGAGELGQLQIEVTTHKGAVTAVIHAEQPSTQKLLVEHMQHLKETLVQAGHNVEKIQVETSPDGSMFEDFTRQQTSQSSHQENQNDGYYSPQAYEAEETTVVAQPTSRPTRHVTSRDQLDIAI